jgi:hypothetical protein
MPIPVAAPLLAKDPELLNRELPSGYCTDGAILPFAHAELKESVLGFPYQYHSTSVPY